MILDPRQVDALLPSLNVLLTFTGSHDPFVPSAIKGQQDTGPVLTVVTERKFDVVCLMSTPRMGDITKATATAIRKLSAKTKVEVFDVPLADPTNYVGILNNLRKHFRTINRAYPEAKFFISVSSGTPHMHASWLLLAASGEIPATILQSSPAEFVPEGKSRVKEIDFTHDVFPQISRSLPATDDRDIEQRIIEARQTLGIVGDDPAFTTALYEAAAYADFDDAHVLLLGETGSGKEYFSAFIHHLSRRGSSKLLTVNCGSIPENLAESHLFGHKKGSFTGAASDSVGRFKAADGGILFLDELGELPLTIQAKLLRVLDQGEIEPVGANEAVKVNVRVIAATNRDLAAMVADGTFREDLYQRFNSVVKIPALRSRRTDIPKLATHILTNWNKAHGQQRRFAPDALAALVDYSWPGNIRELRNVITQSAMLASGKTIAANNLRFPAFVSARSTAALPDPELGFNLNVFLDRAKEQLILRAMEKSNSVQARAAQLLGLTPQAVNQFLKGRKINQKR